MKLGLIKRLDKADFAGKGDLPAWVDVLLGVINGFMDPIARCIQGRISLADNMFGYLTSGIKLSHGVDLKISTHLTSKPIGVQVLSTNGNKWTGFNWTYNNDGTVTLNIEFKDTSQTNVPCTLFIYGG